MTAVLRHLGWIESNFDPRLAETFRELLQEVNLIGTQTGASGTRLPAPPNIRAISVTAQNGQFTITLTDPDGQAGQSLGIHYFLEWDTNPAFTNPTVEDVGPARGESLQLGNLTLYWRAYSQYRNSPISKKIVYGGTSPIAVAGGGNAVPPPLGGGSGGAGGGGGFGGQRFFQ